MSGRYRLNGGIISAILNFDNRSLSNHFHAPAALPLHPFDRRLDGPQGQIGTIWKEGKE